MGFLLRLPRTAARLWAAVGTADTVHAGPSHLWRPFESLALLLGWTRRKWTVYVVDIDHRRTPHMQRSTGRLSLGAYLRARYLHGTWMAAQTALACRVARTVFLKGRGMVADYGRGRPNVHYLLDSAHSDAMVLAEDRAEPRFAAMAAGGHELKACYFGRLVAYKGIDRMIEAVRHANAQGCKVTLDIYGDGDARERVHQLADAPDVRALVTVHPAQPYGPAFFGELSQYDALLAAPLSEDTPRSAVDAQALGMPVIAFDTYYYRELAEDGAGVVLATWPSADQLGERIVELAKDRRRLAELARSAVIFARDAQERWLARRAAHTFGERAR